MPSPPSLRRCASAAAALALLAWGASGCGKQAIPDPQATLDAYQRAAKAGDVDALYELMTERSQQSLGKEGVRQAVTDAKAELAEQAQALSAQPVPRIEQVAKVRFADGEQATLALEDGGFRVSSADALPVGARTPAQALEQLRKVLARRSYAGLMRVLSKETRSAVERDLRSLVEGLERPDALEVKVQGDQATVQVQGGHVVKLHREGGVWTVEDFDLRMPPVNAPKATAALAPFLAALSLLVLVGLVLAMPRPARAFGDEGAFHPRILLTGTARWEGPRKTAPAQWSWELKRRTSAPARTVPGTVRADASALLAEPFVVWAGDGPIAPLSTREIEGLRTFLLTGGVMFVDDAAPETGLFGREARRELGRVLPDALVMPLPENHVIYHSFYMIPRPVGRVEGPKRMEAIIRGGSAQVIFSSHDVLGALARDAGGLPAFGVVPRGDTQREHAARLAVNLAMYVLCSNYKDDQVHAPDLMKRRASQPGP